MDSLFLQISRLANCNTTKPNNYTNNYTISIYQYYTITFGTFGSMCIHHASLVRVVQCPGMGVFIFFTFLDFSILRYVWMTSVLRHRQKKSSTSTMVK